MFVFLIVLTMKHHEAIRERQWELQELSKPLIAWRKKTTKGFHPIIHNSQNRFWRGFFDHNIKNDVFPLESNRATIAKIQSKLFNGNVRTITRYHWFPSGFMFAMGFPFEVCCHQWGWCDHRAQRCGPGGCESTPHTHNPQSQAESQSEDMRNVQRKMQRSNIQKQRSLQRPKQRAKHPRASQVQRHWPRQRPIKNASHRTGWKRRCTQ